LPRRKPNAEYQPLKVARDALAARFEKRYPELAIELSQLLTEIRNLDESIVALNSRSPGGYRLEHAEPSPKISDKVELPSATAGQPALWPPRRTIDPAMYGPTPVFDPRYSDEWWKNSAAQQQILLERAAANR